MASRKATLVARALVVHDGKVLAAHHRHLAYEVLLVSDGAGETTGRLAVNMP